MENYNLTAELKKIASGITASDPNTELGNINSGVGNLANSMNGVATAITNKTIPDPTIALGNIATTIGTKAIPDPNANIQAVANSLSAISGGKSLVDIESILASIRATLTQIGLNNVVNLTPTTGGFIMTFGGGAQTMVPNEAQFTGYTDTYNIGATNSQSAIDEIIKRFQVFIREQGCINGSIAKGIEWDVDELMTLVRAGEFDKFAIGDYITDANTSIEFAITAKNYYPAWAFGGGSTKVNHIVLMPFTQLATSYAFNSSNTNSGGYAGSNMPSNMVTEYNKLSATIRGYCQSIRMFENNKGSWTWTTRYMRLPTVVEVTGNTGMAGTEEYSNAAASQLPLCRSGLFRTLPSNWYWLLDPSSYNTTNFCLINTTGASDHAGAANSSGTVRPIIVLA